MGELVCEMERYGPTHVIGECNRLHPLRIIKTLFMAVRIVAKERPDVIVTTGSLPLALLCAVAKMTGCKVVWIDSIANTDQLSMSGSFVRHFADLFLVQWPDLASKYKNAQFVGTIL